MKSKVNIAAAAFLLAGFSTSLCQSGGASFTQITDGELVTDPGYNCGSAWADYDNDGFPDLFVHHEGPVTADYLYHNNGDGTFTRLSDPIPQGLTPQIGAWGNAWGDYDNDGHLDLFMANYESRNVLLHNRGDGTFEQILTGPGAELAGSGGGIWGDYDRDGYPDLLVINSYLSLGMGRNSLYHNERDGTFKKMTAGQVGSIVSDSARWLMASWVDANDDGWLDLFTVSADKPRSYSNLANGGFGLATNSPLMISTNPGAAFAWADYDNDGRLDVCLAGCTPTVLLHQGEDGTFNEMSATQSGIPRSDMSQAWGGVSWGDYDNDGFQDLLVAGGSFTITANPVNNRNFLCHNNGDGSFTPVTAGALVEAPSDWMEAVWVDYDRDGFLDVFAQPHGVADPWAPNALHHNDGNPNHWLCVTCVGTSSPRDGTGVKVHARATIRGQEMWQLRLINTGGTCWGGQSFIAHFGLGDAAQVDVLRIEWPSGTVQELSKVASKQYLTLTEPPRLSMRELGQLQVQCWKGVPCTIEASTNMLAWTTLATVTNLNLTGGIEWTDSSTPPPSACFYRVNIPAVPSLNDNAVP